MTQPTTSSENISQDKTFYPRRTERRLQIRANLIRTAAIMFSRNGYSQTTLAEVAEAADVHVQTLYRHFSSKEDLALAAAQTAMDDCRDFFENAGQLCTFAIWRRWIEKIVSRLSTLGFDQKEGSIARSFFADERQLPRDDLQRIRKSSNRVPGAGIQTRS